MDRNRRKAYKLSLTPISCPLINSFIFLEFRVTDHQNSQETQPDHCFILKNK